MRRFVDMNNAIASSVHILQVCLRDWSGLEGSYCDNTGGICCSVQGRPKNAAPRCIYHKMRSKSPPNRSKSPSCLHFDVTPFSLSTRYVASHIPSYFDTTFLHCLLVSIIFPLTWHISLERSKNTPCFDGWRPCFDGRSWRHNGGARELSADHILRCMKTLRWLFNDRLSCWLAMEVMAVVAWILSTRLMKIHT